MDTGNAAAKPLTQAEYDRAMSEYTPAQPLDTITSEEVAECRFKRREYLVEGLLSPGLAVLAGSPKVGKSWLVLQLCLQVAKGEPFWGQAVRRSDVLYLALEDSQERLQKRVLTLTSEPSPRLHFATSCSDMDGELEKELIFFIIKHPLTRLVVIDTFQMIRAGVSQMSYANDYAEVSRLKAIADELDVCILLVHHTRKMADNDRFNEISGTNGIAGCADTLMVLTKEKRADRKALLSVTGRDVEDLELKLEMDRRTCTWQCNTPLQDWFGRTELPTILHRLVAFMKEQQTFDGTNRDFSERFSAYLGETVNMSHLSRKMAYYRYELEDRGVSFVCQRTHSDRGLLIIYRASEDKFLEQ